MKLMYSRVISSFDLFKPHPVYLNRKQKFPCVSRMISYWGGDDRGTDTRTLPEVLFFFYPGKGEMMPQAYGNYTPAGLHIRSVSKRALAG